MPEPQSGLAHFDTGDRTAMQMLAICLTWAEVENTAADQYVESDRAGEGAIGGGGVRFN